LSTTVDLLFRFGQEHRNYLCVFGYSLVSLAAMHGRLEKDDMVTVQARRVEAFGKLRLGFTLSIVSVVMFALSTLGALSLLGTNFLFVLVPATYFLGIYERASGWKLLGFGKTETVMWLSAILLALSPLSWVFAAGSGLFYSYITIDALSLVPPALWAFYTIVESHNVGELEKKLGLNLRRGRIFALCGILTLIVAYGVALFSGIGSATFYLLPFNLIVFAAPFLILSCVTFIRKLKLK